MGKKIIFMQMDGPVITSDSSKFKCYECNPKEHG